MRFRRRVSGFPASSNGASSMHAWWVLPGGFTTVSATLEVLVPPVVDRLYFWALQASFADGSGAHLGLQWHPSYPGSTAANWGGYAAAGGELEGTGPNTRAFGWTAGRPHRLTIRPADDGWWAGLVDGVEVRRLRAGGPSLSNVVVWSEVFARCDDPSVVVRWSDFVGDEARPSAVRLTYQSRADGGCDNTATTVEDGKVLQTTSSARVPATVLSLSPAP